MAQNPTNLKRPRQPMPDCVRQALESQGLMARYRQRPAYQQNDYLGWIQQAKRDETKHKRLDQMLRELKHGGVYMNMEHPPSRLDKG